MRWCSVSTKVVITTRDKNPYYKVGEHETSDIIELVLDSNETLTPFEYFGVGVSLKYLCRLGRKPGTTKVSDLKKIINYSQQMIDRIEREDT